MKPLTVEKICDLTGARLGGADSGIVIQSISTDSRTIKPGCLFIAINGENQDGHHHLQSAATGGAVAAMVHAVCLSHLPLLSVNDTRTAMGQLAAHVRQTLGGTVIAVAGSNGKTGTKHLVDAVLTGSLSGTISPKSFNNDIGVPLTIFSADPAHDYLVLEIGTNHPGEILNLARIAQPDVAIITNIGAEHLEFLGDLDGVTAENAQIIQGLKPDGLLIVNGDHRALLSATQSYPGRRVTFGFSPGNDLHPTEIRCDASGVRFRVDGLPIFVPLLGRHTAVNALAAIAVARHLKLDDAAIIAGLATATGPEMRLQLQTAGSIRILNDAYNANPHSMRAALETLRDMKTSGRKVAVLGDMRELGETADRYHLEIGQFIGSCGLDQLFCVGEKSRLIARAAIDVGIPVDHYETAGDCAAQIPDLLQEDDLVLLKASRGIKLESIAAAITATAAGAGLGRKVAARMKSVIQDAVRPGIPSPPV